MSPTTKSIYAAFFQQVRRLAVPAVAVGELSVLEVDRKKVISDQPHAAHQRRGRKDAGAPAEHVVVAVLGTSIP